MYPVSSKLTCGFNTRKWKFAVGAVVHEKSRSFTSSGSKHHLIRNVYNILTVLVCSACNWCRHSCVLIRTALAKGTDGKWQR